MLKYGLQQAFEVGGAGSFAIFFGSVFFFSWCIAIKFYLSSFCSKLNHVHMHPSNLIWMYNLFFLIKCFSSPSPRDFWKNFVKFFFWPFSPIVKVMVNSIKVLMFYLSFPKSWIMNLSFVQILVKFRVRDKKSVVILSLSNSAKFCFRHDCLINCVSMTKSPATMCLIYFRPQTHAGKRWRTSINPSLRAFNW